MGVTFITGPRQSGKSLVGRGIVNELFDKRERAILRHDGVTPDQLEKDKADYTHVIVCFQGDIPKALPTPDGLIQISLPKVGL